jgi:hypothetical protein
VTLLHFSRGHDPAATQRVIVPIDPLMDDDQIEAFYREDESMELLTGDPVLDPLEPRSLFQTVALGSVLILAGAGLVVVFVVLAVARGMHALWEATTS